MDPAISRTPAAPAFQDGFGTRHHIISAASEPLEVLALRDALTSVPAFDFALRERVSRLASFRHACYGPVRGVSRLDQGASTLSLVSDRVLGERLSEILAVAESQLVPLPIEAGLCLIRQLVDAVAILHETVRDVCHGAIAPERLVITPDARLVIVEHVFGGALASLSYSREQFWKELRVALPATAGAPRFDRRADVTQVGAVALTLILGRPLRDDDYPERVADMAARVGAVSASGGLEPLSDPLRTWLLRALQLDPRNSFASAVEARTELDGILSGPHTAGAPALKAFLGHYSTSAAAASKPAKPATIPIPDVVPPVARAAPPADQQKPRNPPSARIKLDPPTLKQPKDAYVPLRHMAKEAEVQTTTHSRRRRLVAIAIVLLALVSGGTLTARRYLMGSAAEEPTGTLVVNTNPAGVMVAIDGRPLGKSPITARLPAGHHMLELVNGGERRQIPVLITGGGQVSQFIEVAPAAPRLGQLQVRTEPAGARVSVDGHFFGTSPVTVDGLTPGSHAVVLENEMGSFSEDVTIQAGAVATLVVPVAVPKNAPVSGWISIAAPVDVLVYEKQRLLGSSRSDRIMVAAGRHDLEIVNEALGYRAAHTAQVAPGQVSTLRLQWPNGTLSVNALPWAEVWIDGKRIGETPIGNVSVPIGPHEVVFRHPELGEQRHHTTITLTTPARLSVDLRKK